MVNAVGEWLGTRWGFWFNIIIALGGALIALYSVSISTLILSIAAIVLPAFILKRDHDRDAVSAERDKAMHAKLDTLIAGVPKADNKLIGVEEET